MKIRYILLLICALVCVGFSCQTKKFGGCGQTKITQPQQLQSIKGNKTVAGTLVTFSKSSTGVTLFILSPKEGHVAAIVTNKTFVMYQDHRKPFRVELKVDTLYEQIELLQPTYVIVAVENDVITEVILVNPIESDGEGQRPE